MTAVRDALALVGRNSLDAWKRYLRLNDCSCPYRWQSLGTLYGVSFGHGWVRQSDDPKCPHHGGQR